MRHGIEAALVAWAMRVVVVAHEVRSLARSTQAARDTATFIEKSITGDR
jgi:hypothetical protein